MNNKDSNIHIVNLNNYEPPQIIESKKDDFVLYGEDNLYFDYLIERYIQSPTNHAVINNIVKLIYGKGLCSTDSAKRPEDYAQMRMLFSNDCIRRLASDLKMLGQCAIQVLYNTDRSKIVEAYHVPVQLLRAEKCSEKNEIEAYYFSNDWSDIRNYEPERISAFGMSKDDTEILYIRPYSVNMRYYSYPDWIGGINYSQLETEIAHYLVSDAQTSFSGTKVINLNSGVPDEEKRQEIKDEILRKLTGSTGQKTIVSFNHDAQSQTTVEDIQLNNAPSHYEYLSDECMRKILLSHGVVSPMIFGVASTSGMGSNKDELLTSFQLYMNMAIRPFQDLLIDGLQKVLTYNEVNLNLYFETLNPFEVYDAYGKIIETQPEELSKKDQEIDLSMYGEYENPSWVLIDDFEVDLDQEETIDRELELAQTNADNDKPQRLSRVEKLKKWLFVSTGNANPAEISEQDWIINDLYFITRYKYEETEYKGANAKSNPGPSRPFCRAMMREKKLYRKEDLDAMSNDPSVNPGFGPGGSNSYSIMAHKGGVNCYHVFRRRTYVGFNSDVPLDPNSNEAKRISVYKARKYGYRVRGNPTLTSVAPINTPNQGRLK